MLGTMPAEAWTVLTWNVLGARGLDVARVAAVILRAEPDVVVLQEVRRSQARRLAAALDMRSEWRFKHVSLLSWPEGAAVLTPHRFTAVRRLVLRRSLLLTWMRRIAVVATVQRPGASQTFANVHLSPHDLAHSRRTEARRLVAHVPGAVIAGDLNGQPGHRGPADIVAAGWTDAWAARHTADPTGGATNWTPGARTGRPPTQRLDYVMVPPGWRAQHAEVLAAPAEFDSFAALSDHLPVVATIEPAAPSPATSPSGGA